MEVTIPFPYAGEDGVFTGTTHQWAMLARTVTRATVIS